MKIVAWTTDKIAIVVDGKHNYEYDKANDVVKEVRRFPNDPGRIITGETRNKVIEACKNKLLGD